MPTGHLIGTLLHGAVVALVLAAPRRPFWLMGIGHRLAAAYNEVPLLFALLVLVSALGTARDGGFGSPGGVVALVLTVGVLAGLGVLAAQQARDRPVLRRALAQQLGPGAAAAMPRRTSPAVLLPVVPRPREVERVGDVPYGPAGRAQTLDLFRSRDRPEHAPVLVYLHPGGYVSGSKSRESRALLFRLARQGWLTISANYRLRPDAGFHEHLADTKSVLAWVREHGPAYGADPRTVVLAGGSAGGHLATLAALTPNQPRYQPDCPDADTSVSAAVSLYGWFAGYYEVGGPDSEAGPLGHSAAGAPPFLVVHGRRDPLAHVEHARRTVAHLRAGTGSPVVHAELPGGQHTFDLFRTVRSTAVDDAVVAFLTDLRGSAAR